MRIVHVEDRFEPTAGYQINEMICQHLKRANKVIIITSNEAIFSSKKDLEKADEEIIDQNPNLEIIRLNPIFVISGRYYFKGLMKIVNRMKPDVLFIHGIVDFKDLILFKKNSNYPIYRDCHMSASGSKNKMNKQIVEFYNFIFARLASKKYREIYYLGEEEKEYLLSLGINSKSLKPMLHGYNGDTMRFDELQRKKIREELHVENGECLILYTGKLDKFKQPHKIFEILNSVDNKLLSNIKICFIGNFEEDYKKEFMNTFNNFKLKEKCIFLPSKKYNELYKYYSASDICIWPKQCTLSSIHSQICKNIVVMEDEISNTERVYQKKNLFKENDIDGASQIIERILLNKEYIINDTIFTDCLNFLSEREYGEQIEKIELTWIDHLREKRVK